MIIKFTLNNEQKNLNVDPGQKLSWVLRQDFGLLSVNGCCNTGRCGGCTVIKDNLTVPACMVRMFSVKGSSILTYEYISQTREFKTAEKVLESFGCTFCDFCRHGRMVTIYSLLQNSAQLADSDIYEALSSNICSCMDFPTMATGIKLALNAIKRGKRAERR